MQGITKFCTYNDTTERGLRIRGDRICLVKNDDFEWRIWVVLSIDFHIITLLEFSLGSCDREAGEMLDLVAHDGNTALVTGIELEDTASPF